MNEAEITILINSMLTDMKANNGSWIDHIRDDENYEELRIPHNYNNSREHLTDIVENMMDHEMQMELSREFNEYMLCMFDS